MSSAHFSDSTGHKCTRVWARVDHARAGPASAQLSDSMGARAAGCRVWVVVRGRSLSLLTKRSGTRRRERRRACAHGVLKGCPYAECYCRNHAYDGNLQESTGFTISGSWPPKDKQSGRQEGRPCDADECPGTLASRHSWPAQDPVDNRVGSQREKADGQSRRKEPRLVIGNKPLARLEDNSPPERFVTKEDAALQAANPIEHFPRDPRIPQEDRYERCHQGAANWCAA